MDLTIKFPLRKSDFVSWARWNKISNQLDICSVNTDDMSFKGRRLLLCRLPT